MNLVTPLSFPETAAERDRWTLAFRGPREVVDPNIPYAFLVEEECFAEGEAGPVATIFLTNRECPWHCTMCDLWRHTLTHPLIPGQVPEQIRFALERLPSARQLKLYNSGSFFDPKAIPVEDYPEIARLATHFERVIVESHPSLIGRNCLLFQELLHCKLEVAMGLETAHPAVLDKLNKRMTLDGYAAAARRLLKWDIDLRSFILVQPPFMDPEAALYWAERSIDFALACQATAVSLIPTRPGNGGMEELARLGEFILPELTTLEAALAYGIAQGDARVFLDLWDIDRFPARPCCFNLRVEALRKSNLLQRTDAIPLCASCSEVK